VYGDQDVSPEAGLIRDTVIERCTFKDNSYAVLFEAASVGITIADCRIMPVH
jgi:hypothetical protein